MAGTRPGRSTSRGASKRSNARLNDSVLKVVTSGDTLSAAYDPVTNTLEINGLSPEVDHGLLAGLGDDDHSQYALADHDLVTFSSVARLTNSRVLTAGSNITVSNATPGQTIIAASGGVTDHGALTGLSDDDHPQYVLKSSSVYGGLDANGRLTLVSGNTASLANTTAATTLYYESLGLGGVIWLYTSSVWTPLAIGAGVSLSLSGYTSGKNYDIWAYSNAGTLTLDSTVWTSDTARATAITLQDGVYCKNGSLERRYIGTIRMTGTGQAEDSRTKRFVWNMDNRIHRPVNKGDTTVSWTYGTAAWRQARADATNQVEWVQGVRADTHTFTLGWASSCTIATTRYSGIGVNSTTPTMQAYSPIGHTTLTAAVANGGDPNTTDYNVGYNYATWCEFGSATGTVTFYGQNDVECLKGRISC